MNWIRRRATMLAIVVNIAALLSMGEALRTSIYVCGGLAVPRNPFAPAQASADEEFPPARSSTLTDYRIGEAEKRISEMKDDIKELRADFTHITEMLIGALLAVVINLAITIITHRRRRAEERTP